MDRHQVFATNIFVQDDFLFEETSLYMKNYIQRLWKDTGLLTLEMHYFKFLHLKYFQN